MQYDLAECLQHIDPALLDYQEWVNVGMALKDSGYSHNIWDEWSRRDKARYHPGECEKKWTTFNGTQNPITAGTIVQMAKDYGWSPSIDNGIELEWDAAIGSKDNLIIIDKGWIEGKEVAEPKKWRPVEHLVKYLETLFEASENVGYVTQSWEKDSKFLPSKGLCDRTAGELIQQLNQCNGDIGAVIGDYNPAAGAWIRFNPLDGNGVKNENVTDFRYALVESDSMDIDKQNAIIRELELPIACLVYSGKKSLHAIVKIEAATYEEYRKRVDYLYTVLKKNGMAVDTQNKNPSRLSRMPGVMRNGHKQFLIDINIGKENWGEWKEWIEGVNDDLPEPESLTDVWNNMPELSPPLIDGVLRQGHKMLIAGPSKAGKSYALIELCCAIAEGNRWLSWKCAQGKILYVNLELDRASCLHRFKDVYASLGWEPNNLTNIDIWNLRGKSVPMDKLAPKLIRRASKKNYIAIIIDPIYKVITGDENSADQMAHFCNQFDKVCTELGCAVIYCHHHSKGAQGGKRSMDRASGSGVFARDPDALLDLIELNLSEDILKQEENNVICRVCEIYLKKHVDNWEQKISQDDICSSKNAIEACKIHLSQKVYQDFSEAVSLAKNAVKNRTAWRIEGTLREFPKFSPVNLWFDYPIHNLDQSDTLKDVDADNDTNSWKRNFTKKKTPDERKKERKRSLEIAFEACKIDGKVTVKSLAEYMNSTEKTTRNRIKEHGGFWIDEGIIGKK